MQTTSYWCVLWIIFLFSSANETTGARTWSGLPFTINYKLWDFYRAYRGKTSSYALKSWATQADWLFVTICITYLFFVPALPLLRVYCNLLLNILYGNRSSLENDNNMGFFNMLQVYRPNNTGGISIHGENKRKRRKNVRWQISMNYGPFDILAIFLAMLCCCWLISLCSISFLLFI